jgi:hypothetical protein
MGLLMRGLPFLLVLSLMWFAAAPAVIAQEGEEEHIETDRDSFTPATTTAGCGRMIFEAGYSYIDNRDVADSHSFPEFIARYGINDWLELRVGANYEVGGASSSVTGGGGGFGETAPGEIESEAKVIYGFKAAITEEDGWKPQSAAIVQWATPTSGPESETHMNATYVWGWKLADDLQWDSAIRYGDASEDVDHFNRWAPSTVLKYGITEKWYAHVEYFGIFTDGRDDELSQSYVSPGIHYLVTKDCEVGVRVGWGLDHDAANFFSNVGIGVRF